MHRFFSSIIGPMITLYEPNVIVEIGAADGMHTRLLLNDCIRRRAVLHTIDPAPQFPAAAWVQEHPDTFIFHAQTSIAALPAIPKPDLVLIDGDHNYATVRKELEILYTNPAWMPLIMLHDVDWPYARRDMYHDPSRLAPEDVHPNVQRGLETDRSGIVKGGLGMNATAFHALTEGGPKNGVLTAVEDIIKTLDPAARWVFVPGFHGLGILAPARLQTSHPTLWSFLDLLETTAPIRAHITALEEDRFTARYSYEREVILHNRACEALAKKESA